jgi:hypothetical protein
MSVIHRLNITIYIKKFKNSNDFNIAYSMFDPSWLNSFTHIEVNNCKMMFDCIRFERYFGDYDENTKMVFNDFIKSLENLLMY